MAIREQMWAACELQDLLKHECGAVSAPTVTQVRTPPYQCAYNLLAVRSGLDCMYMRPTSLLCQGCDTLRHAGHQLHTLAAVRKLHTADNYVARS